MIRFFNFSFVLVFFFQITSIAQGTSAQVSAVKTTSTSVEFDFQKYSNHKISDLFLTMNEIEKLSDDDRAQYFFVIIQLATMIEYIQGGAVGFHSENPKNVGLESNEQFVKINLQEIRRQLALFNLMSYSERAEAVFGAASVGLKASRAGWQAASKAWGAGSKAAAASKATAVSKLPVDKLSVFQKADLKGLAEAELAAEKGIKKGQKLTDAIKDLRKTNDANGKFSRDQINEMKKGLATSPKINDLKAKISAAEGNLDRVSKQLVAAKKSNPVDAKLVKKLSDEKDKIAQGITTDMNQYFKLNPEGRLDMMRSIGKGNSHFWKGASVGEKVMVGATAYTVGQMSFDGTNWVMDKMSGSGDRVAANLGSGAEGAAAQNASRLVNSGQTMTGTPEAGEVKWEAGRGCLFGGHPSELKNFQGEVKCTEPKKLSKTTSCNKEEKFKCNSFGITEDGKGFDKELCISRSPLATLTNRCSQAVAKVFDLTHQKLSQSESVEMDRGRWAEFQGRVKKIVQELEASPFMQDGEGKVRTLASYCNSTNTIQRAECDSIQDMISILGGTRHMAVAQQRLAQQTSQEGTGSSQEDSGSTAPGASWEELSQPSQPLEITK